MNPTTRIDVRTMTPAQAAAKLHTRYGSLRQAAVHADRLAARARTPHTEQFFDQVTCILEARLAAQESATRNTDPFDGLVD